VLGCVDFELPPSLAGHKDWYDNFFFGVVCKGRHAKLLHRYARSTCLGSSELIYLDLYLLMLGDEVEHPACLMRLLTGAYSRFTFSVNPAMSAP